MLRLNEQTEMQSEDLVLYVYDVEYCWQDGYGRWYIESIRVTAEDEDHAAEKAAAMVDMPYGVAGVEYRGEA